MADVHSKEVRSFNMSRIKGKNTKPEILVRKFLFAQGFRYRLHDKKIIGKPDIVIKKYKTIIDVRGCFWHGHAQCKFGDAVKKNTPLIAGRIQSALERDKRNEEKWRELGWSVIIIWDSCELEVRKKESEKREKILANLLKKLLEGGTSN